MELLQVQIKVSGLTLVVLHYSNYYIQEMIKEWKTIK